MSVTLVAEHGFPPPVAVEVQHSQIASYASAVNWSSFKVVLVQPEVISCETTELRAASEMKL